jgi:hypothetical protein
MVARVLKFFIGALALAVLVAIAGLTWLFLRKPATRPAAVEVFERTPARMARGDYLVHAVDCLGCHSEYSLDLYGAPPRPGTLGQGGFTFNKDFGVPGYVSAQNITPDPTYGIGKWTDGEVLRAVREGVDRNGNALFPMMPYPYFHAMSDEDGKSIVVYLRTLKPINRGVPPRQIDFPVNLLIKGVPRPEEGPVVTPDDAKDHLAYGRYLVTIIGCRECHTAHDDKGGLLPGREFAGGWEFKIPRPGGGKPMRVVSANITPHPDAFFGKVARQEWIDLVHSFVDLREHPVPAPEGSNTVMPWLPLSTMTDQDLGAIYDYIKTLPPIPNEINSFPDRT